MKQIDIVIIGQNYCTSLGLIQAAGEAGYGVGVVHISAHPVKRRPLETKSKYVVDYMIVSNRTDEQQVLSLLISRFSSTIRNVSHTATPTPSSISAAASSAPRATSRTISRLKRI